MRSRRAVDHQGGGIWRVTFHGNKASGITAAAPAPSAGQGSTSPNVVPPEGIHPNAGASPFPILPGASPDHAAVARVAAGERRPPWGTFVHHSDRRVQYACAEYTGLLQIQGIAVNMSRVGNPYDNAKAERFIRTLKSEEVDGTRYRDQRDAAGHIGAFIDQVYEPPAPALRARLSNARRVRG